MTVLHVFTLHCWLLIIHYSETAPRYFFLLRRFQPVTQPQVLQVRFHSLFEVQIVQVCSRMKPMKGAKG